MSAAPSPAPTSDAKPLPSSQAVSKILTVPLVSDSLKYAQATLDQYPHVKTLAAAGSHLAVGGLRAVEPIASHFVPQLQYVDGLATKGLDLAESKLPYAFKATPHDVAKDVKAAPAAAQANATAIVSAYKAAITDSLTKTYSANVADPLAGVYNSRVVPTYAKATTKFDDLKAHNDYVKALVEKLTTLQAVLTDRLAKIKKSGQEVEGETVQEVKAVHKGILSELAKLRSVVLSLPADAAARFHPIKDTLTDTYTSLSKEAAEPNVPLSTKLSNIIHFLRGQFLPALQKAVQHPDASAAPPAAAQHAAEKVADKVDAAADKVAQAGPSASA